MEKNLFSLLFISTLITLSSCSHLDTVKNGSQPETKTEEIHSRIPSSPDDCNRIIAKFINKKNPSLEIAPASIFGKYPEIQKQMYTLFLDTTDYMGFYKEFFELNKKAPTLRDVFTRAYDEKIKTIKRYEDLIMELENLPTAKNEQIQTFIRELKSSAKKLGHYKSIEQIDQELTASFQHGKISIPDLDTIVPLDKDNPEVFDEDFYQFVKNKINVSGFQGEYGELFAHGASGEQVLTRGLTFAIDDVRSNEPYQKMVADQIIILEKKLNKMSNDEISSFIEPHKEGLFRIAFGVIEEDQFIIKRRDLVVEKIINMIRSKEIDLVTRDKDGKIVWAEVKAYIKPITMKSIGGHGKEKTVLDQLREHKALRDVLGLEASVRLRFIAPLSPVSDDAKSAIEKLGYEVISAK
ncbi:MAG: hypothetical protein K2Q18_06585 [Bdellovibrionales bacterium]|nr:hypothetical protein [Bdellovibrionales bacterium]